MDKYEFASITPHGSKTGLTSLQKETMKLKYLLQKRN